MKEKMLIKTVDLLWEAEKILEQIVEDSSEQISEEEELFINLSSEISYIRNEILSSIRYPKIEELSIEQIIEAVEYGMREITDVIERKEMEHLIIQIQNGRLEDYKYVIDWEIKNWYLNRLKQQLYLENGEIL